MRLAGHAEQRRRRAVPPGGGLPPNSSHRGEMRAHALESGIQHERRDVARRSASAAAAARRLAILRGAICFETRRLRGNPAPHRAAPWPSPAHLLERRREHGVRPVRAGRGLSDANALRRPSPSPLRARHRRSAPRRRPPPPPRRAGRGDGVGLAHARKRRTSPRRAPRPPTRARGAAHRDACASVCSALGDSSASTARRRRARLRYACATGSRFARRRRRRRRRRRWARPSR